MTRRPCAPSPPNDLNPVRANIAEDPKDYRWSGYGEAVAGGEAARAGLTRLVKTEVGDGSETATWAQIQAVYRCWLYEEGQEVRDENGQVIRSGFSPETTEMVINRQQGALAWQVLVKLRVRHFTEGMAIGRKTFIEGIFQVRRNAFPPKRSVNSSVINVHLISRAFGPAVDLR